jgi:YVTN family beta-propeller protein
MSLRIAAVFIALLLPFVAVASAVAGNSNSLLDISPDGGKLLVANPDNDTVTVVDTAKKAKLHEIKVGDKPEGVAWIGSGPLAVATVYRDDLLVFIDADAGTVIHKLKVPAEPYGVVTNREGTRAYISHEYPGTVSEIDLKERKVLRELKAGTMVRGIALSPDENRVYVTEFYTGALHALDLKEGKVVDSWSGHATDNLARHVVVHPTRPKAYVIHQRSRVEIIDSNSSALPQLTVYDLVAPDKGERRTSISMDTFNGVYPVSNPWETALSPDGKKLFTLYAGSNDMNACQVVDDDYKEISRVGYPITVGQNPQAVRVSPDGKTVYVYATLDFEVGFYNADTMARLGKVKVCEPPLTPEWVRGKILFSTAHSPMAQRRWVACSTCHPDGASDGRVWHQPEGLRKTPSLFGAAHTHPLHWSADRDEVQDFEYTIRSQLMRGRGLYDGPIKPKEPFKATELEQDLAGKSKDLDALAIYTNSFEFRLSPHMVAPGKLSEAQARGKALFFSNEVGCAKCHSGPYYTDSNLKKPYNLHDVGTGNDDPTEKQGPKYDTPTLLGVYRTAPYLHHGKAKTLLDVLTTCNKEDRHGKTSQLKANELDDLVEFLKALPYETPPSETPNTVKYRVAPKKKD